MQCWNQPALLAKACTSAAKASPCGGQEQPLWQQSTHHHPARDRSSVRWAAVIFPVGNSPVRSVAHAAVAFR